MKLLQIFFIGCLVGVNFAFDAVRDVRFLLTTRRNVAIPQVLRFGDVESVRRSQFDPAKPTTFLIHGFLEGEGAISGLDSDAIRALLQRYDYNVIFVDWSEGASTLNYIRARGRIREVAPVVARFIEMLNSVNLVQFRELRLIGFSLGAHAAGLVGKNVTGGRIRTIVGLDPAGPLFDENNPSERIDAGDAEYVECIHTNGGLITGAIIGALGIGSPICQADFFPNGGNSQPGCLTNTCAHLRAVSLYEDAVLRGNLWANQCDSTRLMSLNRCTRQPGAFLGDPANYFTRPRGIFYLETNRRSPFGQGKWP